MRSMVLRDGRRFLSLLIVILPAFAMPSTSQQHEASAAVERFYIVKLATMDAAPNWADYILDVRANGPDVVVREFQIAPLGRFCSDDVTIKAVEKTLKKTTAAQIAAPLDLCSAALRQQVAYALGKYSYRQAVTIKNSARFGIVAKCGEDLQVIDLPFPQALDQKKLERHAPGVSALFDFFDRLQRETFGDQSLFHEVALTSDEYDMSLQQAGAEYLADLKSGEFDRGFDGRNCRGLNSGCDEHPMEALLKNYKGPVASTIGAQVRLLDREKLPLTRYVEPEYPANAVSAHVQDRLPMELELAPSGKVIDAIVLGGDASLRPSAIAAAKQWEFKAGSGRFLQVTLDFFLQCP